MHTIIVIGGPTASGKTALAIEVARQLNCPILSADSRQFYQEMRIGNARPTEEELAAAKHYFIADRSIHKALSAGRYAEEVLQLLPSLFKKHPTVVMTGGSGLYIKAVCEGLGDFPTISAATKDRVAQLIASQGLNGLQQAVAKADPAYFALVDQQNPRRLQRALEVSWEANQPFSYFRQGVQDRPFAVHYFQPALGAASLIEPATHSRRRQNPKREALYEKINQRVTKMMKIGLLEEARSLLPYRHLDVLKTVGYQEFWPYFEGEYNLATAIELVQRNSRRYAKRQITWFGKDGMYQAVHSAADLLTKLQEN